VEGDIHDIAKDIVVFMLDINGFDVMDLGVDVPVAKFVEAVNSFKPQVVGLSGFLTLAYDPMKNTRVQAVPPDSKMMEVSLEQGRWLVNQDENAIVFDQSAMTAHPDIKIGDTVVMKDDNKKTKWILVGVVKSFFGQPDSAGSAYVPYEYYCKIMGIPKSVRSIMLKVDRQGKTAGDFTKDLEKKLKDAGLQVQRVFTIDQEIESLNTFFLIMLGIFSIMSVLMGFIHALQHHTRRLAYPIKFVKCFHKYSFYNIAIFDILLYFC